MLNSDLACTDILLKGIALVFRKLPENQGIFPTVRAG